MSSKAQRRGNDYRRKRKRFHANQYTRKVSDTLDVDCISASAKKLCKENYLDKEVRNSGKILGGPTAVFGAKKRQIEGFQKGVNDEKLLGSACVSGG
ncbi:hypothetical protein TNCV_442911 [Trichonephila clavipes]|nr:hypothetical protein TNCV_442911 [Trichonephila clavipes]